MLTEHKPVKLIFGNLLCEFAYEIQPKYIKNYCLENYILEVHLHHETICT